MDACFINIIARDYPDNANYQIVQNYREFFEALQYVIPTDSFRFKYTNYLKYHPIEFHLEDRQTLMAWCHNVYQFEESCLYDPLIILRYLVIIGRHYPTKPNFQEVLLYKNFFLTLGNVFSRFRKQYLDYLRTNPVDQYLSSRDYLQHWIDNFLTKVQSKEFNIEPFTNSFNYGLLIVPCLLIIGVFLIKNMA